MNSNDKKNIFNRLALANEQVGRPAPSVAAMESFCQMFDGYACQAILAAIDAAVMSADFITPRAIKEQLDKMQKQSDGHPEPNEAWAVAVKLADESETTEYTDLIMLCWSGVSELYRSDDVGARMAFLEMYKREVGILRCRGERAVWRMSFGYDPARRDTGTQQARQLGRIGADQYLSIGTETLGIEHVQTLAIEQKRSGVIDIRAKLAEAKAALTKVEKVDREDLERKQLADKKLKAAQMIVDAKFNAG
jgi:hypothetical protein